MDESSHADGRHDPQPSSRCCFVCGVDNPGGLHLHFFNDGHHRCLTRVTLDGRFQSYPGIVHGGILATILDETMGRAILAEGDEGRYREITEERFMFTAQMEIRYRKSVPLHEEFVARGWIEEDRGRIAQVRGEIVLADGTVAVEAQAKLVAIPPQKMEPMLQYDIGWRVYGPDEHTSGGSDCVTRKD